MKIESNILDKLTEIEKRAAAASQYWSVGVIGTTHYVSGENIEEKLAACGPEWAEGEGQYERVLFDSKFIKEAPETELALCRALRVSDVFLRHRCICVSTDPYVGEDKCKYCVARAAIAKELE